MPPRIRVQLRQQVQLPVRQHAGADGRPVGTGHDVQHLQDLRRTDFHGQVHDHVRIVDVAELRQFGHHQVPMDQEPQDLGFPLGQAQPSRGFFRQPSAHLAVVFGVAFAQVVDQQGKVQQPFVAESPIRLADGPGVVEESAGFLHGTDRVFVDGVLVEFVELQQAARVTHAGDDLLQNAQLVQAAEQVAQAAGLRDERQETVRHFAGQRDRGPLETASRMASQVRCSMTLSYRLARSISRSTWTRSRRNLVRPRCVALM